MQVRMEVDSTHVPTDWTNELGEARGEPVQGILRSRTVQKRGPNLNPNCWQGRTLRDPYEPVGMLETKAVLAPSLPGCTALGVKNANRAWGALVLGDGAAVLKPVENALRDDRSARKHKHVDGRGKFDQLRTAAV